MGKLLKVNSFIERQVDHAIKWVRPGGGGEVVAFTQCSHRLKEYLDGNRKPVDGGFSVDCDMRARWHKFQWLAQSHCETAILWSELVRFWRFSRMSYFIETKLNDREGGFNFTIAGVNPFHDALSILFALSIENETLGRFWAEPYARWYLAGHMAKSFCIDIPLTHFTILLYSLKVGLDCPIDVKTAMLGKFGKAAVNLRGNSSIEQALAELGEWHVDQINQRNPKSSTFEVPPFSLIPVAYLAYKAVRKSMGLDTPPLPQPILNTPFANPPDPLPRVDDPFLDQLEDAVIRTYPDFPKLVYADEVSN